MCSQTTPASGRPALRASRSSGSIGLVPDGLMRRACTPTTPLPSPPPRDQADPDPVPIRSAVPLSGNGLLVVAPPHVSVHMSTVAVPVFAGGGTVVAALELRVRDPRTQLRVLQPVLTVAARGLPRELARS